MQQIGAILRLSATDLGCQISCGHLVQLERAAAEGRIQREHRDDPALERMLERGLEFELNYVDTLRAEGCDVVELRDFAGDDAVERTHAALRAGAGVIVQAALRDGRWYGRADLLVRIETESKLGPWSYEVHDTKLARETRGTTVLQLCLYSDLVGRIQGRSPEHMHVVRPGADGLPRVERFRCDDFGAYYRLVRSRLEHTVDSQPPDDTYPQPVPHCDICNWWPQCDRRRHEDDHLSLVAGLQALHRVELEGRGVTTLTAFAERPAALAGRPRRGSPETYSKLHDQARVQLRGRRENAPVYELLPPAPALGLSRLPDPATGDVFFDLEADPFVDGGGIEYLFGWAWHDASDKLAYRGLWATDRAAERRAFETFLDEVMERWQQCPGMHVYHFGIYEPAAIKRLMGRHATREAEVDRLLRAGRFVDLHAVVRQGLIASVERYSLKDLEAFSGFTRGLDLRDARRALQSIDAALELGLPIDPTAREEVESYNRDDCLSTASLRGWLEARREEAIAGGGTVTRPDEKSGEASEGVEEVEADIRQVYEQLTRGLPEDQAEWNAEHRARWLLAHMLGYFRREDKCAWWEYYRLQDLDLEDLREERKAVVGLRFVEERPGGTNTCPHHSYEFPPQEVALKEGNPLHVAGDPDGPNIGDVVAVDQARRTLVIKKRGRARELHPHAVIANDRVPPGALPGSLLELARSIVEHDADGGGPFRAARDVLLQNAPRLGNLAHARALRRPEESAVEAALRLAHELDDGALAIQGPPGSGKTHTGARMIVQLARAGKRVGVTAVSHKVIQNLLVEVLKAAREQGIELRAMHKSSGHSAGLPPGLEETEKNDEAFAALDEGMVVGGTAWLWARDDAAESLDVLFADEAGQISLAVLLAAARSARNLVMLGDPQQLEQPQQGAHPEDSGRSALEHLLDGRQTIPDHAGLFLDRTWRLHPDICRFTSEVYYEGRLHGRDGLERQCIGGTGAFDGSGLHFVPVPHSGNQNHAPEEIDAVARIVAQLTVEGAHWIDAESERRPLTEREILVVAPYNAQVGALSRGLPAAVRVGTVDKFQGQEAPVVIYSMASSSVDDAPRGMAFLFNPNRLNVATSRARCACILVAAPALLSPDCRSPEQMRWANGVCRYLELVAGEGVTAR